MGVVDELVRGREAFERRDWATAFDRLSGADPATLSAADLAALATAAYLVGDRERSVATLQRAHQRGLAEGDTAAAARAAFWIALIFSTTGNPALASGWHARHQHLIDAMPQETVESGYGLLYDFYAALTAGELEQALARATDVVDVGERFGDANLVAEGLCCQGRLLLYAGRVAEGLSKLDEAMVHVASGELNPVLAGMVYCAMIEGCQEISDYRRMSEWTTALTQWCEAQPGLLPFTGQCAVHRAQIMRAQGAFSDALDELALATERYRALGTLDATGLAMYERGEVQRVQGDYEAAERSYAEATGYGYDPQPGLTLMWLARGRTAPALAAVARLLKEASDPVHRTRILPAAVEVLLAGGETAQARAAAEELAALTAGFGCEALTAQAAFALGLVHLAEGDPAGALPHLRRAWKDWIAIGGRYDAARARVQIALALRALGDEESAAADLAVAQRTFAEQGAEPNRAEAERLGRHALPGGLTPREVEVLRLVAAGHSNPQIAAELCLSEKTVARHLSNIFTKIDVTSRTAAAAYAFGHQLA